MTSVEEPSMDTGSTSLPAAEPSVSMEEGVSQASTPSVSEDVPHITSTEESRNGTTDVSQPSLMGSGNHTPNSKGLKRSRGTDAKPPQEQTETPLGKRVRKPNQMFADYQQEKVTKSPSVGVTGSTSPSVSSEGIPITSTSTSTPLDATGVPLQQPPLANMVPGSAAEPAVLGATQPIPAKEPVLLTPEQARERNRKLPKGYAYVPEVEVLNPPAALDAQPVSGKRERKRINYAEVSKAKEAVKAEPGEAGSISATTTTTTTSTTPIIAGVGSPVAVGIVPSPSPTPTMRRGKKEKSETRSSKSEKKKSKKAAKKEKNQRKKELQNKLSQLDTQLLHLSELEREMELQGATSAGPVPKEEPKTKKRRSSKTGDSILDPKKRRKGSPSRKKNRSPSPSPPATGAARPQRSTRKKLAYEPDEAELSPVMKECVKILAQVMDHQHAWPFNQPVDPVALNIPDYFRIIKHPMDLGTIKSQLDAGYYANPDEFSQDVRLVWSNAQTFNPPEHDVFIMSKILSQFFESKFKRIADKQKKEKERERSEKVKDTKAHRHYHAPPKVQALPPQPDPVQQMAMAGVFPDIINELRKSMDAVREEIREIRKIKKSKEKRAPPPKRQINIKAKFDENRPMTKEEKRALSIAINELESQHLGMVVQIIHERMPALAKNAASDEIEIDIDNLDTPTLRHLEKYVRSCKQPQVSTPQRPRANARKPGPAPVTPVAAPGPTSRVQTAEQTETQHAKRIQQVEKRLQEIQRETHQYMKGIRPGGRGKEEEDVVIDDEDQGKSYPPVVIEKDKAAESSSDDSSDESDSSSDSDSDSDSSDTDSDSDSSSETESEPEKKSKRKEGKSESNARQQLQAKKPPLPPSATTITTTPSSSSSSSSISTLPQVIAPSSEPKSKPIPPSKREVLPSLSSTSTSSDEKVVFKIEPMQLELGSPPIVAPETALLPVVPPPPTAVESKKEVVIRNADAWANLDEDEEDDKKNNETVSLWSEFKSKDEFMKQKEREREELEQRLRREAEEQEEQRRREEERKKQEEEEAIAERQRQEKEAEEQARKEREARRMAERLEREKRLGRVTTSINDQTEIMASFEQQVSKTNMNEILRSVGVGSTPTSSLSSTPPTTSSISSPPPPTSTIGANGDGGTGDDMETSMD